MLLLPTSLLSYNIGLLIVATGKYITFVPQLIASAERHFCKKHKVTYFIFTDKQVPTLLDDDRVRMFHHPRIGWPYDTMMRCKAYCTYKEYMADMDYLFACDADMRFVDTVGDEILSERVATQHPGFVGRRGTYETNTRSRASVHSNEGAHYFAGGFHGGSREEFLKLAQTMLTNCLADLDDGIIAVWHDESHLNRYFIDNPPTCILSPSYCYPESWSLPYQKRLLALDKNHGEYRA
jgi:histo-blood group ABO system transferase